MSKIQFGDNLGNMRLKFKLQYWLNCDIRSKLPLSTRLRHPLGVCITENVKMGENCEIFQHVTIGRKHTDLSSEIVIGNNVIIYAGACILGSITIGDNSIIGANSVVIKNIPSGEVWAGNPARFIKKNKI